MNRNHLPSGTSVRRAAGAACAVAAAVVLAGPCEVAAQIPSTAAHRSFSLGGALGQDGESYDDFHFLVDRTTALFASADSAIYQSAGRQGEDDCGGRENSAAADTASPAVGADEGGHAERTTLCLQALDPSGQVLCWAERAAQPGWQRDPRLGCVLTPEPGVGTRYTLRVAFADEDCGDTAYPSPPSAVTGVPYLLEGSLRSVSSDGPLF